MKVEVKLVVAVVEVAVVEVAVVEVAVVEVAVAAAAVEFIVHVSGVCTKHTLLRENPPVVT